METFEYINLILGRVERVMHQPPASETHPDDCPCRQCDDEGRDVQDEDRNTFISEIGKL